MLYLKIAWLCIIREYYIALLVGVSILKFAIEMIRNESDT